MNKEKSKRKIIKKDAIFVVIMALTVGSLGYNLIGLLAMLTENLKLITLWALIIANSIAVIGCLWLVRTYRLTIRKESEEQKE
jgi:lipopolysaccharide export LptBFGC system permease protein LptF